MRLALIVVQFAVLAVGVAVSSAQSKSIFDDSPDPSHPAPASAPAPVAPPSPSSRPSEPTLNPEPPKPPVVPPPAVPPAVPPELPPAAPAAKLAPPDALIRAKTLQTVKKVYEGSYAQSTASARRELELEMLNESTKISRNFAAKFVLLQEALRLALATQDVDGCRKAIADLDGSFVVSRVALTTDALKKLSDGGADDAALVTWAIEAFDAALETDDYQGAHRILSSVTSSRGGRDAALRARLKAKADLLAEADRLRPALDKLKTIPDDPAANFMVGRFLCFLKHDWEKGLPHLGRCTDPKLAAVARADLASPTDAKSRFALAGQWWELGDDKPHLHIQGALRERAAYWYQKSAGELTDLDKAMAERRMAAAVVVSAGSANNILMQMIAMNTTPTQSGSDLELNKGKLKAPFEVSVPFRADVVAKTDSLNLRLGFCEAQLIFNWHENKDVLIQTDPKVGEPRMAKFTGKGEIPANQFVTITWIVQDDGSHIYVDGKERGAVAGDYKGLRGPFYVFPRDSAITVRSVSIVAVPPTGGR